MSDIHIETARHNMVVSQLRTGDVLDDRILELVERAPRHEFVPTAYRAVAFADMAIPLGQGEVMMPPLLEARLLQALDLRPGDKVLEIGTGSGYMTWLLAQLASDVHSVEIVPGFAAGAAAKLAAHGVKNASVETGDGSRGWDRHAPYDAILVAGSLPVMPDAIPQSLAVGGRLVAIVGASPAMQARKIVRLGKTGFENTALFETDFPPLRNALTPERFVF